MSKEQEKTEKSEEFNKISGQTAVILEGAYQHIDSITSPADMNDWIDLYHEDSWVYGCCNIIANTIANLDIRLIKTVRNDEDNTTTRTEIKNHPIVELLYNPNSHETNYELIETLSVYLDLVGTGYWEVVYDTNGIQPIELYNIKPSRLTPVPSKSGRKIDHYTFQLEKYKKKQRFEVDEILPFIYFNPKNDWVGQGSVQAAVDEIILNQHMISWAKEFFVKGTVEGTLETDKPLNPKDIQDVKQMWNEMRQRDRRAVPVLGKGLKFKNIGSTPQEVDFLNGMQETQKSVLSVMGVPSTMIGILDDAQYDNFSLQKQHFHQKTIIPRAKKISNSLTKNLVPLFPGLVRTIEEEPNTSFHIEFDTRELEKADEDALTKRLVEEVRYGMITPKRANDIKGNTENNDAPDFFMLDKRLVKADLVESGELENKNDGLTDINRSMDKEMDNDSDGMNLDNKKNEQTLRNK